MSTCNGNLSFFGNFIKFAGLSAEFSADKKDNSCVLVSVTSLAANLGNAIVSISAEGSSLFSSNPLALAAVPYVVHNLSKCQNETAYKVMRVVNPIISLGVNIDALLRSDSSYCRWVNGIFAVAFAGGVLVEAHLLRQHLERRNYEEIFDQGMGHQV